MNGGVRSFPRVLAAGRGSPPPRMCNHALLDETGSRSSADTRCSPARRDPRASGGGLPVQGAAQHGAERRRRAAADTAYRAPDVDDDRHDRRTAVLPRGPDAKRPDSLFVLRRCERVRPLFGHTPRGHVSPAHRRGVGLPGPHGRPRAEHHQRRRRGLHGLVGVARSVGRDGDEPRPHEHLHHGRGAPDRRDRDRSERPQRRR